MADGLENEVLFAEGLAWGSAEWDEEVRRWSRRVLASRNMVMDGEPRVIREYNRGGVMVCTARAKRSRRRSRERGEERSEESIFIKWTVPASREVERSMAAARVGGDIVPKIIGVNRREGVLMQRDAGKITKEMFDQEDVIDRILEMQELSMSRIAELEGFGLRVRDSEWVAGNVERILKHKLFDDYSRMRPHPEDRWEEVKHFRSRIGKFQRICQKITELELPRTIVHGDCWLMNMGSRVEDGRVVYRLFDWATAFIGNPLHDFGKLLGTYSVSTFDSSVPDIVKDWDGGMKQVWKKWVPLRSFTKEETMELFEALNYMSTLIELHDLMEEYDAPLRRERSSILSDVDDCVEFLGIE